MADIVFTGQAPVGTIGAELIPQNVNLIIYKGDFVDFQLEIKEGTEVISLDGKTAKCHLKKGYDSSEEPIAFQCTNILSGSSETEKVRVYMPSSVSSSLEVGDYIWDFQLENEDGDIRTYFAGDVSVINEVTK